MNNASSPAIQPSVDFQPGDFLRMVAASVRQLHDHPALAWITPQLPVRLVQADGEQSLWIGERKLEASGAELRKARFTAIEVPSDLVLTRSSVLPQLSESDIRDAVALEVRDSSPFEPADLVWGYRTARGEAGQVRVTTAIASRRQVSHHVESTVPEGGTPDSFEAWAVTEDRPVVLRGFGEAARARSARRGRWLAWSLILVALLFAIAIAVTPTVQLHLRAMQAATAYQALQQRAGPALAQRDALVQGRENLANLQEVMNEHLEPLVAIDMLTQLIPDDTWLQRVQAQGNRFTLTGQTPNAAALMNALSSNAGLRDVRAPTPATRAAGGSRENFVVEFTATPGMLRRPAAATGQVQAPAAAAMAASASQAAVPAASTPTRSQP